MHPSVHPSVLVREIQTASSSLHVSPTKVATRDTLKVWRGDAAGARKKRIAE